MLANLGRSEGWNCVGYGGERPLTTRVVSPAWQSPLCLDVFVGGVGEETTVCVCVCVVSCFCDVLLCVLRESFFTRRAALLLGGSGLRKKTGQLAPSHSSLLRFALVGRWNALDFVSPKKTPGDWSSIAIDSSFRHLRVQTCHPKTSQTLPARKDPHGSRSAPMSQTIGTSFFGPSDSALTGVDILKHVTIGSNYTWRRDGTKSTKHVLSMSQSWPGLKRHVCSPRFTAFTTSR